jgi:hypothetical protein
MNWYEFVVFISWVAALWGIISASRQQRSAFESIGHTKWKWVVINTCGLIPYLGLVTAGIYGFRVFRHLPTRRKNITRRFSPARSQSTMDQNPAGYNQQPSTPAQPAGFTVDSSKAAKAQRIACSACGTTGRVNEGQVCYPCGGIGYI